MGSIYWKFRKDGTRFLLAQATTPDGRRLSKTCDNRKAAQAWIVSIEEQANPSKLVADIRNINATDGALTLATSAPEAAVSDAHAGSGNSPEPATRTATERPKLTLLSATSHSKTPKSLSRMAEKGVVILVKDLIDRYLKDIMPAKRSTRAPTQQLHTWRKLLGDLPAAELTPERVARAKDSLLTELAPGGRKRTPATINRYLAAFSHVFTVAMKEWFVVSDNPVLKVRRCKEPRGRELFLTPQQRKKLLKALANEPEMLRVIIVMALYSGMRQAEIMSLKWRHVDLERCRVTLEMTKNGRPRAVSLVGPALAALEGWSQRSKCLPDTLLFPSPANPAKPFDIRRGWNRVRQRMGMPEMHFHDLRHCTASYMAMSGATAQEIANVLGHRTLSMVSRYSHMLDDHCRPALQRMAEKIFKEDEETD